MHRLRENKHLENFNDLLDTRRYRQFSQTI